MAGLRAARDWASTRLNRREILILGATRMAADEFARTAAPQGSVGLQRLTLLQLAAGLALPAMAERNLAPLSRLGAEAVAARVTYRLLEAKKLSYFTPVARLPGFPAALASTIADLRLSGVRGADLRKSDAAGDLRQLLAAYEEELADRDLADVTMLLDLARQAAAKEQHPLLGLAFVLLDVPLPSRAHQEFLGAVARRSESVLAIAQSGDQAGVKALESALGVTAASAVDDPGQNALAHVRRRLFSTRRPPQTEYDDSVALFSAPGEGLEAVEIARRIHAMAEQGLPFDRVAILLRSPERYQSLVEEALRRAGIPAYFSRGSARPDPAGRAFLALLACAAENFSASRFAEYLSLGQAPSPDAAGAPVASELSFVLPADELFQAFGTAPAREEEPVAGATVATPIAWERLLVDAAVIGGRERWARRLKGLEQEYKLQLASLNGQDESKREGILLQLERLANLERFALPLIDLLGSLPQSATWREWLEQLRLLAVSALRHPESVLEVVNELEPMAEVGPADIDEITAVLGERLRFLRREPPRRHYGRVYVASIQEARGRSFDVIFLPGLAEGLFPRRALEDPLLLDQTREAVSPELSRREDRVAEERLLLRTAVASAGTRLIASYPSMDLSQGRPRVPSFYALEIARAIEGRVPKLRGFESRTAEEAEARLIWPAPRDPVRAIDDAEYDLAWHRAHAREPGSGRYLMEVNESLARSLRFRYLRWEKKWSKADGLVAPDEPTRKILEDRQFQRRAYSASSLQHFSACPYRFFLHGIYGLREREEGAPLEQMDPLTRGALFHAVQFEFFTAWRQNPNASPEELLDRLDAALDRVAAEFEEKLAPAIPRVWRNEIEDLRTDLRGWMRLWRDSLPEWEPVHFEYGFGLTRDEDGRHDPASRPEPVVLEGGIRVRGSIDLIERHRSAGVLRVVDHKTGKAPETRPAAVAGGSVLQPALYGLAAEALFGANASEGRLFYCTQRGGFDAIDILLSPRTRQWFYHALDLIQTAIRNGFLPAAPQKDACGMCDYRLVCGPYEENRAARFKDLDALDALVQLRNLP